jgi:hypothetical protein
VTAIADDSSAGDFEATLAAHRCGALLREETRTLQVNAGKLCNQACHHCHVDAGPERTEIMTCEVAERTIELLGRSPTVEVVDITGGAPELNPNFRWLVAEARKQGRHVIDRCNLTGNGGFAGVLGRTSNRNNRQPSLPRMLTSSAVAVCLRRAFGRYRCSINWATDCPIRPSL